MYSTYEQFECIVCVVFSVHKILQSAVFPKNKNTKTKKKLKLNLNIYKTFSRIKLKIYKTSNCYAQYDCKEKKMKINDDDERQKNPKNFKTAII